MNVLEDMIQNYANAGLFDIQDPSLIEALLSGLWLPLVTLKCLKMP